MSELCFIVDKEISGLCPPLGVEEAAKLEANILADGCRDALVIASWHSLGR
jgi:hypothetical protein